MVPMVEEMLIVKSMTYFFIVDAVGVNVKTKCSVIDITLWC